jgi:hypothetical protein
MVVVTVIEKNRNRLSKMDRTSKRRAYSWRAPYKRCNAFSSVMIYLQAIHRWDKHMVLGDGLQVLLKHGTSLENRTMSIDSITSEHPKPSQP